MGAHLLQYCAWSGLTQGGRPAGRLCFYAASSHYGRVGLRPGDTLWIVSLRPAPAGPARFVLCGRLAVHLVTGDRAEATRRIRHYDSAFAALPVAWHAFAREGAEEPYGAAAIDDLAPDLRFLSTRDRLRLEGAAVNPQQLLALRRLAPDSAARLEARWRDELRRGTFVGLAVLPPDGEG